MRFKLQVART